MPSQCSGTNKDGRPCSAHVEEGRKWCAWHDPDREADRAAWRRKGGANRSNRIRARKQLADQVLTIGDLDALLCNALVKVAAGRMTPGIGLAMAGIAKTITSIRTAGDLERRLTALEGCTRTREGWPT